MRFPGFIGPSYTLKSISFDCQRCINLYPEVDEIHTGKENEVASLIGTPGLSLLTTAGSGPIRGAYQTSTGQLYVVSGIGLYTISSLWSAQLVGTLSTTTGTVSMSDNGLQLFIVDGKNGYYVTLGATITPVLTKISNANWLGSNRVTFQDGYFIFAEPNTKQFYLSDLNDITFTAPALSSKEGNPDNIVSIISSNKNLWLLGDQTTEVWFNSGDNLTPFQYIAGSLSQYGCAAAHSVAKIANSIFWLGKDTGTSMVFMASGYTPQRISTHAVEYAIQGYSDVSDAIAYTYQEGGHQFYVLTFPTGNATWVYDLATGMWHERAYLTGNGLGRQIQNAYAFAYNTHVVGDYANGKIYKMDSTVYTDNTNPIVRQRVTPHISKDMDRIFYFKFELDFEPGTGTDGTNQGNSPQAMLQWSNDGGHKWSNEHWATLSSIGSYMERAVWNKLGYGRNRVFKLSISDPVKVILIGAQLDFITVGDSD